MSGSRVLRWPRVSLGCASALVVVAATVAVGADVRQEAKAARGVVDGQVHLVTRSSRRLASAGAYPGRTVEVASERPQSELSNVIVFVKSKAVRVKPMHANIRQTDEEFLPHLVAVTTGSTVDFPNDDLIFHNVFSLSRAGTFDLGRYSRGNSRSRVFTQPGLIKVYCHLHSHMNALIRVFDHPYFVIPSADGTFSIGNLDTGAYDVVAWHERVGEVTLRAVVAAGQTTHLVFSLPFTDTP